VKFYKLTDPSDWSTLTDDVGGSAPPPIVTTILALFRDTGAVGCVLEDNYIDRDFSAAYAAFYATLFKPYLKHCRRAHFFSTDLSPIFQGMGAQEITEKLGGASDAYLGFITLRPIAHAPIGMAIVSAEAFAKPQTSEISVAADYQVHLLGADLTVRGLPVTQQDTRVGACAQAAIWTVGRHFHERHRGPWYSMADITELALKPMDSSTSQSLPAGSSFLTLDNMVRALRAMDRHPIVHVRPATGSWTKSPAEIAYRYLDSGIPVILGLRGAGETIGHAVVALGREITTTPANASTKNPTLAEGVMHFFVCDDQRGPYCRLPVKESDRDPSYPWTLENDCEYLIVSMPSKVFVSGEIADSLSRGYLKSAIDQRDVIRNQIGAAPIDNSKLDNEFEAQVKSGEIVTRTYLTFGWRYRSRLLRNLVPDDLKMNFLTHPLPRYVWVTEFSKGADSYADDPCIPRVHAHVALDATGSHLWESGLVLEAPGISILWKFEPAWPSPKTVIVAQATDGTQSYWPKVRGWQDFSACVVPTISP